MTPGVTVVGIGADGWGGLSAAARDVIGAADVVLGGQRQLDLVQGFVDAELRAWPSPMLPALPEIFGSLDGSAVCALASGDPMSYGLGTTLARVLGADAVTVVPHPSSIALACARLGWAAESTAVVSVVGRPLAAVRRALAPDRRVLVLSAGADTPGELADLLTLDGWGTSAVTVLEQLGGPREQRVDGVAQDWAHPAVDALNVVAITCAGGAGLPETPGLPDDLYDSDGQLTKREIRAVTLALLGPRHDQLLWDVGAGSGSIGIEWARAGGRAIAVEASEARADRVRTNAAALGVPQVEVVHGRAPEVLADIPCPDAVFIGGGLTGDGVLDACWTALQPGGRLVANAVTVESEVVVAAARSRLGGELTRLQVSRAAPLGGFTGWRSAMPVTIWSVDKQ